MPLSNLKLFMVTQTLYNIKRMKQNKMKNKKNVNYVQKILVSLINNIDANDVLELFVVNVLMIKDM